MKGGPHVQIDPHKTLSNRHRKLHSKKMRMSAPVVVNESDPLLYPLISEKITLRSTYGKRKEPHLFESIDSTMLPTYEEMGWTVHKEGQRKTRIKKEKETQQILEDQVWCLFFRLGYPVLSGSDFHIHFSKPDGSFSKKTISVFAKDDETVIVAICKSRETRGKKSLQKDLLGVYRILCKRDFV